MYYWPSIANSSEMLYQWLFLDFLVILCLSFSLSPTSSVPIQAFLSHEDLLPDVDNYVNHLTLNRKLYPEPTGFPEFTMCMRIKILSFKERKAWSGLIAFHDGESTVDGYSTKGGGFQLRDPSDGSLVWFQTFIENMAEITEQGKLGTTILDI